MIPDELIAAMSKVQGAAVTLDGADNAFSISAEIQHENEERVKIDAEKPENWKPGRLMADGDVYAGISPETKRPMYTRAADALYMVDAGEAKIYTRLQRVKLGQNYRLPSEYELQVLFNNRAAIGGFKENSIDGDWYWSGGDIEPDGGVPAVCFNSGQIESMRRSLQLNVRLVRD